MSRRYIAFMATFSLAMISWHDLAVASGDQVREFAASVACSQVPVDACTWLDAENYRNLRDAHKAQLRQKFCGTTNAASARQIANSAGNSEYPNPNCTKVLHRLNELR